jgi:hypothetical protein
LRAAGARAIVTTFLPAILILIALWPAFRPIEGSGDTFQFWYAGHLVVSGASPYDQSQWQAAGRAFGPVAGTVSDRCSVDPNFPSCVWVYLPITAWLFAPFGALPPQVGVPLLDAFVLLTALAGVVAVVWTFGPTDAGARSWLLVAAVASHPFGLDVRDGQFVGVLLLGLASLERGLRATRTWPICLSAVTFLLKPHVGLAVVAAALLALVKDRRLRAISSATFVVATVGALPLAWYHDAIPALMGRAGGKADLAWATTWAFAAAIGARWVAVLIIAIGLAATLVTIRALSAKLRAAGIVATSAAMSLAIAPYLHPYDMLLALPLFALAAALAAPAARPRVLLAGTFIFVVLPWLALIGGGESQALYSAYALLPTGLLVLCALSAGRPNRLAA